jgi:hypothetical protein
MAAMYECEQAEILQLPFWHLLQGNLWHAMSLKSARSILKERAIRHDTDDPSYPTSFCRSQGGISLFDFTGTIEHVASQFINWRGWFGHQPQLKGKAVVWFRLDRTMLSVKTAQETKSDWFAAGCPQLIPHVETCHIGPIPAEAINGALVISVADPSLYLWIEPGRGFASRIAAYAKELPKVPKPTGFLAAMIAASKRASRR